MKRNCNFTITPVFWSGVALNLAVQVLHTLMEPAGTLNIVFCFAQGAAVGLLGVGLLYGSPKTRPLFDRFHTFKLRLPGRENAN